MARAKRAADQRSASAIAEDLRQAREAGGLLRADETDLAATSDLLILSGVPADDAMPRARDLLLSYVRRGCQLYQERHPSDLTARAAAAALQTLLSKEEGNATLARVVRESAARSLRHAVSPDAIRKREDRIISEIAEATFVDLEARLRDEPASLEAAVHKLVPLLADLRQDLHDLLILTFQNRPPADPQERRLTAEHHRRTVLRAARVMVACEQLFDAGLRRGQMSYDEHWFMGRAASLRNLLFCEADDRPLMRRFATEDRCHIDRGCDHLQENDAGRDVYARWIAWTGSCYPTCAFERTWDTNEMCSPHVFVTEACGAELHYIESGFSKVVVPGNDAILLHQRLRKS